MCWYAIGTTLLAKEEKISSGGRRRFRVSDTRVSLPIRQGKNRVIATEAFDDRLILVAGRASGRNCLSVTPERLYLSHACAAAAEVCYLHSCSLNPPPPRR